MNLRVWLRTGLLAVLSSLIVNAAYARQFDPSPFEYPEFMAIFYNGTNVPKNKLMTFKWYTSVFVDKLDKEHGCRSFIRSAMKNAVDQAATDQDSVNAAISSSLNGAFNGGAGNMSPDDNLNLVVDKASRDADAFVDRYGCEAGIAGTILHNIGVLYGVKN